MGPIHGIIYQAIIEKHTEKIMYSHEYILHNVCLNMIMTLQINCL